MPCTTMHALAAVVLTLAASTSFASTYLVRPDGSGDFPTIQAAVDAAMGGDVIELASGSFSGHGNRDIDYLGKAVTIKSTDRDPSTCVINCGGSHGSPHRGFMFTSGETDESVLEGVTITEGYADYSYDEQGGGIYCEGGSPTLTNCVVSHCTALNYPTSEYGAGGGIYCKNAAPLILGCTFCSNVAGTCGGGAWLTSGSGATLTGCLFEDNTARSSGGLGISWDDAVLTDCVFVSNTATEGGAGAVSMHSCSPLLTDIAFIANWAVELGGAIKCAYGSSPSVTNCSFESNMTTGYAFHCGGGAIACYEESSPSIVGCRFANNYCLRASSCGGGGALYCFGNSSPTVADCAFYRNGADGGGASSGGAAVFCWCSSPELSNCTLVENRGSVRNGGACCASGSSQLTMVNCIVAFSDDVEAVACCMGGEASLVCCDLFDNAGGDWVGCAAGQLGSNGNICEDPLLCASANPGEPLMLQSDSPCVASANPECGLIGAWDVGCTSTVVRRCSWGAIKREYWLRKE